MLLKLPTKPVSIKEIPIHKKIKLFIKREDQIHPLISGNKILETLSNVNHYLGRNPDNPYIITFGGAFSNHIAAVSAVGSMAGIPTLGIIRGEELQHKWRDNLTLLFAKRNGMNLKFVTRRIPSQRKTHGIPSAGVS